MSISITPNSAQSTLNKAVEQYSKMGVSYEGESAHDLAIKAGLNWKVKLTPVKYTVEGSTYTTESNNVIYREDKPNTKFSICGKTWKPLQNETVLSSMIDFCDNTPNVTLDRVGFFKEGKTIWALANTNLEFTLNNEDVVKSKILLINNHSFGKSSFARLFIERCVCTNQLVIPLKQSVQNFIHSSKVTASTITDLLSSFHESFNQVKEESELLSKTKLELDTVYLFVLENFSSNKEDINYAKPSATDLNKHPKAVKQILNLYMGAGQGSDMLSSYNTNWGLLNAITEWTQYSSVKKGGLEGHLNSLWLESKARKNQQVYTQLVSLARV